MRSNTGWDAQAHIFGDSKGVASSRTFSRWAKPVGNGYPMGVVIANRSLIEAFQAEYGFFSTFGGGPVAAAAGRAVLAVIDREKLMANARDTGAYLRSQLQAMAATQRLFRCGARHGIAGWPGGPGQRSDSREVPHQSHR